MSINTTVSIGQEYNQSTHHGKGQRLALHNIVDDFYSMWLVSSMWMTCIRCMAPVLQGFPWIYSGNLLTFQFTFLQNGIFRELFSLHSSLSPYPSPPTVSPFLSIFTPSF